MASQLQQSEDNISDALEVTTELGVQGQGQIAPVTRSIKKGQEIVSRSYSFLVALPNDVSRLFNQYRQLITSIALIVGIAVALKVVLAIIDALDDIPLVAPTLELVGIGYSIWFTSRFLVMASKRQELVQQTQALIERQGKEPMPTSANKTDNIAASESGNQQLFKPGEIVPESGRYQLINAHGSSEEREVTSTKGEHFPPTPEPGMHYQLVDSTRHKDKEAANQQEKVTTPSEEQQLFKPGETVPESGQYQLINAEGRSEGREVTSTKGEHFPPTPEPGMHYQLVDPTRHKKE